MQPGNDIFFSSDPTSPRRTHQHHSTLPMTPYYHPYSELDESEFEFENSRSSSVDADDHVTSQKAKDSFLRMLDQQWNDNQRNMLSPLKLPLHLHQKRNGNQSPRTTPSSPRSPSFILNFPFASRRLWNDDFGPFMVAMENVKEEEKGTRKAKTSHHNTGSSYDQQDKQNAGLLEPKKQVGLSPKRLALPKGLEFASQVRLIQMGPNNDKCSEVKKAKPMPTATVETPSSKIAQEISGGPPFTKETKGQKIKRLLMSAYFGKVGDENIKSRDKLSKSEKTNISKETKLQA